MQWEKVEEESRSFIASMRKVVDDYNTVALTVTDGTTRNTKGRQLIQKLKESLQGFKLALKMKKIQETEFKRYEQVVYDLTQEIRTMSVAYKRRMDQQRARDREQLLATSSSSQSSNSTALRQRVKKNATLLSNTRDVTSSLRRTRQIMSAQVERAQTASVLLDDGKQSLRSTNTEYQHLDGAVDASKKLLTDLERQARADKLWILAGFSILGLVILYIMYQRIGFRFF